MKQHYENLVVWQRSMALVPKLYECIRSFPAEEKYALSDQIRRSAVSIPANIAEGQSRQHPREFLQYLAIARGSMAELHTLLILARNLKYLPLASFNQLEEDLANIGRPLSGLMTSLRVRT